MLTMTLTRPLPLLDDSELVVETGELIGIAGASGAGKTTLLQHLASTESARGTGPDHEIGFVPQDDIIHLDLPLRRTLQHAVALRLGFRLHSTESDEAVDRVLAQLDLDHRASVPVRNLSGGERKRASVAVELLTDPATFFLDEPTSGLDPVTGASVLNQLRKLTNSGTTVFVTTHTPDDLDACDRMILLNRGGDVAFIGSPDEARIHFEVDQLVDVYAHLETKTVDQIDRPRPNTGTGRRKSKVGAVTQWRALTQRNLDLLSANKLTLAILLGSPTMVISMLALLFRAGSFNAPNGGLAAVQSLFWISFSSLFFGVTYGLLQIVTETPIVRRERIGGLHLAAYVASKVAILVPILTAINAAMIAVLAGLDRLPSLSTSDLVTLIATGSLISVAGLAMGLTASAFVENPAQAMLALPGICFPQVLFAGAAIPTSEMATIGRWMSYGMANRWGFESMGRTLNVDQLVSTDAGTGGFLSTFDGSAGSGLVVLAVFTVAFLAATVAVLRRRLDARS